MATYYIATTGNDTTGDGSSSNPWLTLSKFLTARVDNDTLIVKDGTYTLTANVTISQRTIQAENNGLAIFDGGNAQIRISISGSNTFEGLVFQRFYASITNIESIFYYTTSFGTTTYNNCTFTNNRLGYSTGLLRGPMFYSNNSAPSDNATFHFNSCLWYDNYVNQGGGSKSCYFGAVGENGSASYVTLYNCTIINNVTDGTNVNSMFISQSAAGLRDVDVRNCIVYNSSGAAFSITYQEAGVVNFTTSYSDYYDVTGALSTEAFASTGVITSDPLFIDPATNNYNLSPLSPCIDAGTLL